MGYAERVLQPGETIAYRARLHWVIYLLGIVFAIVAIAAAGGAVALKNETLRIGQRLGRQGPVVLDHVRWQGERRCRPRPPRMAR